MFDHSLAAGVNHFATHFSCHEVYKPHSHLSGSDEHMRDVFAGKRLTGGSTCATLVG